MRGWNNGVRRGNSQATVTETRALASSGICQRTPRLPLIPNPEGTTFTMWRRGVTVAGTTPTKKTDETKNLRETSCHSVVRWLSSDLCCFVKHACSPISRSLICLCTFQLSFVLSLITFTSLTFTPDLLRYAQRLLSELYPQWRSEKLFLDIQSCDVINRRSCNWSAFHTGHAFIRTS
jgi:hypothetical protein